jgi:hypothetical protein
MGYGDLFQLELSRFKTLARGLENFKEAIELFRRRRKKKAAAGGESGNDDGEDSE